MIDLPPATPKPCSDCPWRTNAAPGWLGPMSAREWVALAHSEAPIACHQTIPEDLDPHLPVETRWLTEGIRQCRGAAMFRVNICKSPRNPTDAEHAVSEEPGLDRVFGQVGLGADFVAYHERPDRK